MLVRALVATSHPQFTVGNMKNFSLNDGLFVKSDPATGSLLLPFPPVAEPLGGRNEEM